MKKTSALFSALILVSCSMVFGQASTPAPRENPAAKPAATEPILPYTPGLDVTAMDKSADPCVDFHQYTCGGWQKRNPIPPDQTSWSVYGKLYQENLEFLRGLLEQASLPENQSDAVTKKIGDYYAACMDEAGVEKRGVSAIKPQLDAITALKSKPQVAPLVARLHLAIYGNSIMFGAGSTQDPDDSEQQIAGFDQGGLGLPDRDYYSKDDKKSQETRDRYVQHVQKIFELLGDSPGTAKKNAGNVMRMETELAKASLTRVERRDPYKLKNKMKVADLEKLVPNFDWAAYLREIGTPKFEILNVTAPAFFKQLNAALGRESLDNWKNYLRYHVANEYSPYLSSGFVREGFEFYLQYLRGAKELQPRWRRCVQYVDRDLGEALGQGYVHKVFSPELKTSTLEMVRHIENAMEERIRQLEWMGPATKEQARVKLRAIRNKVGYPDKWRDYSLVSIDRDNLLGNVVRATQFESHRQINKIGQPVDRGEWGMTPPTVNAYYNAQMNDINFPAGVLQPPLYDAKMDDAPNYGNTGGTIGHELTHGFDDEGRQFDAKGNLKDWWTKEDAEKFKQRTQCIEDQYSQYVVVDDVRINSKLTLGEDVADLGGEIMAYLGWKAATKDANVQPRDGFTPDQRFFIGFAQWACSNERPEDLRLRAVTDPHSPPKYRVNGVVVNMPEFAEAFGCKAGQPMVKPADKVCRVW